MMGFNSTPSTNELLVQRHKGMTRVCLASVLPTVGTIVPVGAAEAFVTDAIDILSQSIANLQHVGTGTYLITIIANRPMTGMTSRSHKVDSQLVQSNVG